MYDTQTIKAVIQTEGDISGNIVIENNVLGYNELLPIMVLFRFWIKMLNTLFYIIL